MSDKSGFYSVVQFSARPSSFEYVNVGILVILPQMRQVRVLMSSGAQRVKKLFDDQNARDFRFMAASFHQRLESEFANSPSLDHMSAFAASRANLFRLLPFRPILIESLDADAKRLFDELVGEDPRPKRKNVHKKFHDLLFTEGVLQLVEANPIVNLPGLKQPLRADYGYQNGKYNLIEAVSIPPAQEISAVTRIAGYAQLLRKHSDKRLIVVADIKQDSEDLLKIIEQNLENTESKVYPLSNTEPLLNDIKAQALKHGYHKITH